METIKVFWKDKFGGKLVSINAVDFNPDLHRREWDGPWTPAKIAPVTVTPVSESVPVEDAPTAKLKGGAGVGPTTTRKAK